MSNNKIKAVYAVGNEFKSQDNVTSLSLGFAHELGPRTEVYVAYTTVTNDAEGDYGTGSIGPLAPDGDPSTLALGMIHMF